MHLFKLLDSCFLKLLIFEENQTQRGFMKLLRKDFKVHPKGKPGHVNLQSAILRQTEIKRPDLAFSQPGPHLTRQSKFSASITCHIHQPWDQEKEFLTLSSRRQVLLPHCSALSAGSSAPRQPERCSLLWHRMENEPRKVLNVKTWDCSGTWFLSAWKCGCHPSSNHGILCGGIFRNERFNVPKSYGAIPAHRNVYFSLSKD